MTNEMSVPSWTYLREIDSSLDEYTQLFRQVLLSGTLLFGDELRNFEQEFASYIGVKYGIGCDNATNGIFLSLKALDIGAGDQVVTVPNTAIPTVSAIVQSGAEPVFCDVNEFGLMDIHSLNLTCNNRIKAIVPVHLFGFPCDMPTITDFAHQNSLYVIEDCSQAHGAKLYNKNVGSFSDISVFSFYPTKPLGGFGDAGMVLTDSDTLAAKLRKLRFYGIDSDYHASIHGYNSRMDELHAAILRRKLARLDAIISERLVAINYYNNNIIHPDLVPLLPPSHTVTSNYLAPYIYKGDRNLFQKQLQARGVITNISYKYPIHLMDAYKYLGYSNGDFPRSEYICDHIISLPIFNGITFDELSFVVDAVNLIP